LAALPECVKNNNHVSGSFDAVVNAMLPDAELPYWFDVPVLRDGPKQLAVAGSDISVQGELFANCREHTATVKSTEADDLAHTFGLDLDRPFHECLR
jgi:hypothetical protein